MPIGQTQRRNIEAFLHEKAEEGGGTLTPETFPKLLYDNWDDVIVPARMARRAKRRELNGLIRERNRQDTERPDLDAAIAALEAEVGP